jgi:leucyl-tRNA synthetase
MASTDDAVDDTVDDVVERARAAGATDSPAHRYSAAMAADIEHRWQERWEADHTFEAPNPAGPLADPERVGGRPKLFILDMFPYPSGAGLHVGHPLGYIGTDVFGRYRRMKGFNVLHALGYDAFGLPAEQYAIETGTHPQVRTEENVATYRRQLHRLGLAHDPRRSISTTDESYYRWTQWIFLQIFESWYDGDEDRARPIAELREELASGTRPTPDGRPWASLSPLEQRRVVDDHRLAYISEAPVNWCPGLGTVLANEEVTAEGRSDRGNFPVFRRNMRQWMLRITAYADRLIDDLDALDWPDSIKTMQRNWIGRSDGAMVSFTSGAGPIEVFTTRPDTLFGATFMVLAPEHPMVDGLTAAAWPERTRPLWTGTHATPSEAVNAYRAPAAAKTDLARQADDRDKTGVFTGSFAVNPVNGDLIPVFIADYVLMGYGTGAIMAVPGQDERDWEFAERFDLPIVRTVQPPDGWEGDAYLGDGPAINSATATLDLNGMDVATAKRSTIDWLVANGHGEATTTYRLRDWLFSRQRYWGEPFPIVFDETGLPIGLPESMLPVTLPPLDDFRPRALDPDDGASEPELPLSRVDWWATVVLDLGDGPKRYQRELNVMPQWAGSCWYELRYLDPTNENRFVDPEVERYWMGPQREGDPGGVDLYVGGVEHAVLHLLYARFWHKVLFDLGHVSSWEPYRRLFNQGYILAAAYKDDREIYVDALAVEEQADGSLTAGGRPVTREWGKMGKSLKNAVGPDDIYANYGADTLRLYEMSMGPFDTSRPWSTRDIVGYYRFLQKLWRNLVDESTGASRVVDEPADDATRRILHRTIDTVSADYDGLRFNTAIAKLIELNNHLTKASGSRISREVAEPLVLMMAPVTPHVAEELWARLGHGDSLAFEPFPVADPALLVDDVVEYPVQVNGKVRGHVTVAVDASPADVEAAASADAKVQTAMAGKVAKKVIVVPGRLVNIVV